MFKFALFLVCFAVIEGRNIQRFVREESTNVTDPELNNATASADDAPDVTELQADLVAPSSGPKPLEAKYTIRVRPKLKDGVPQIQEIRIMPPKNNATQGFVKPLMVLKQNVTKPMIENIEIDVPEKGVKFASKPSVEVIEGGHREMMKVTKGQVVVENAAQKSDTNSKDKEVTTQDQAASQNTTESSPSQNTTEPSPSKNTTEPSPSQNTAEPSPSQNTTEPSTSHNATEPSASQNAKEPLTSEKTADSASSQKAPQQPNSQDEAVKNSTTSTQAQGAPQQAQTAAVAPQNKANAAQATSQTQTAAVAPQNTANAAQTTSQTQTAAVAPQNTVNSAQTTSQTQPSAQAAPVAPVYSQPAAPAPAPQTAAYTSVPQTCNDNVMCRIYPDDRCREQWLMTNCRLKCKMCSK